MIVVVAGVALLLLISNQALGRSLAMAPSRWRSSSAASCCSPVHAHALRSACGGGDRCRARRSCVAVTGSEPSSSASRSRRRSIRRALPARRRARVKGRRAAARGYASARSPSGGPWPSISLFFVLAPAGAARSVWQQLGGRCRSRAWARLLPTALHHAAGMPLGWASVPRLLPDRGRRWRRVGREHGRRERLRRSRRVDCVRARRQKGLALRPLREPPPSWPFVAFGKVLLLHFSSGCCPSSCSSQAVGERFSLLLVSRARSPGSGSPGAPRQAVRAAVVVARAPAGRGPRRRVPPARPERSRSHGHGTRTAWIAVASPMPGRTQ